MTTVVPAPPLNVDTSFEDITTEICTRVNDPLKDTYGERAESLFVQAVCELAIETPIEEIQELVVDIASSDVVFANHEASVDITKGTLKVIDVFIEPEELVTSKLILKAVDHDDIKRMNLEPAYKPAGNECFWYRAGNTIRFLLSNDWDGSDELNFTIQSIFSPDKTKWTGSMIDSHGYSRGFLYRCIDNAVAKLRAEL